jgi:hypothetical protein
MLRNFKVILAVLVVLVLAGGAYAFAAANTIAPSNVGYKDSVVSGYDVTGILYNSNSALKENLDSISFDVEPIAVDGVIAKTVQISVASKDLDTDFTTSYCAVTPVGETTTAHAVCTFGTKTVPATFPAANVLSLNVLASSNPALQ